MASFARLGLVVVLGLTLAVGCGKSATPDTSATGGAGATTSDPELANNPIAQVASDFLDAIVKGDTERGTARLTPQARDKIVASGMKFDPPGVENPQYRIVGVGVAADTPDHAFVQYEFSFTAQGQINKEDMACALRQVNNSWCVYGLVHGTGPGKPWNLRDFETDTDRPVLPGSPTGAPQQEMSTASRPSPPRATQETPQVAFPSDRR